MPEPASLPFASIRILDLSSEIAGPYATKLFVDAGAEVVKVERPGGDPLRSWSASHQDLAEGESGPLFQYLNAGKQSIVLDSKDALDRTRISALAARADILIEDWGAGGLEDAGFAPEAFLEANARLAIVRISPWGQQGPWASRPANDFTIQAATGSTQCRGFPEREPVSTGGRLSEWAAGTYAAVSALAAWRSARQTGDGQIADLSSFEVALSCLTVFADIGSQFFGVPLERSIEIPSIEPTKDGYIGFCTTTRQQWVNFCSMLGHQEIAEDPRFLEPRDRFAHRDFIREMIHAWTLERTTEEILELCDTLRIPATPIGNGRTLPGFDHFIQRKIYQRSPEGFLQPRPPWRLESTEAAPLRPSPGLDQQRESILASLEKPAKPGPRIMGMGTADLPFAGLRIVDLTAFWAGPVATTLLADLGADVIKVESIQRPDGMRFAGSVRNEASWEWSPVFHGANPGKRDITLRLDRKEGLDLLKRLIRDADIVIENFSVRVMPGFGLDADTLRALNPRIIFVRMPAFGLDGPWRDRAGFAMNVEQVSGLGWLTGYEDQPLVPRGACDPIGGMHTLFAIGIALEERRRTGLGQLLEVALVEPGLNIAAEQVLEYSAFGVLLGRSANKMPHAAPQGVFPSSTESQRVALSVTTDEHWRALCQVLGADDLRDSNALSTHHGRFEAHDLLCERVAAWVASQTTAEAVQKLLAGGVPAGPVINPHDLMPNPQLEARRFFQVMKHPHTGETRYPGFPAHFSAFERRLHHSPPPTLGQHNREILQGELGLDDAEIDRLEAGKIIGTRPSFM
ncbi:MAG: CoA transferase [Deltaproteobacteria bacterium]|nr:CoA transferase [Deltaproteobacteria bacterium]